MPTSSISWSLISHVRTCLDLSLEYVETGRGARHGHNAFTPDAYPAYVSAVAAVEAFLNESLLGSLARAVLRDSPLWNLGRQALDKMELRTKLIVIPHFLFGRTFERGTQPYQDFALLVKVRNDIVHFKMEDTAPPYVQELSQRGIALTAAVAAGGGGPDYAWPHKLSSTEGIRWANNAACKLVAGLVELIPAEHRHLLVMTAANFQEIPDSYVEEWFRDHPEDPRATERGTDA